MKKQKRSQNFLTYIIIGIFTCVLIGIGSLLLIIALPSESDYDNLSEATAQFLEQYPAQSPDFIRINEDCLDGVDYCFRIIREDTTSNQLILKIDGQVQDDFNPIPMNTGFYGVLNLEDFASGLHLIELQIQDNDGRIVQHAWTIRIESDSISPPATLAVPPTYVTAIPDEDEE